MTGEEEEQPARRSAARLLANSLTLILPILGVLEEEGKLT
jgi:hypothetical protein